MVNYHLPFPAFINYRKEANDKAQVQVAGKIPNGQSTESNSIFFSGLQTVCLP